MVSALVLCLFVLNTNVWASIEEATKAAEKIQAFYEATRTFTADFEQEVYWRRGEKVRVSRGKVWFKKPGRMRWEYLWPEPLLVVCDGREVFVYNKNDNQVMVFPSGKALSSREILGFMSGKGDLLRDFIIERFERLGEEKIALTLKPRNPNAQVERLRLVADAKSGAIAEIWFWDYLNNLTKIRFKRLQRNQKLSENLFRFAPPKGAEIIRER